MLKRMPSIHCPGCGVVIVMAQLAKVLQELEIKAEDCVIVSGIGCTGRVAFHFACDTVHTLHGRAIPVAEGIKTIRPELKVIVLSGDADLLEIGLQHLIHAARRRARIIVICCNNGVAAMTGGQSTATTPLGIKTKTALSGENSTPLNIEHFLYHIPATKYFYSSSQAKGLLREAIKRALRWDQGLAFVDVKSRCVDLERHLAEAGQLSLQ